VAATRDNAEAEGCWPDLGLCGPDLGQMGFGPDLVLVGGAWPEAGDVKQHKGVEEQLHLAAIIMTAQILKEPLQRAALDIALEAWARYRFRGGGCPEFNPKLSAY